MTLSSSQQRMIETASILGQRFGLPEPVGQIFGLLCFSSRALSLGEIAENLGMSPAGASTAIRQLLGWGAIRQAWTEGDRTDCYEVEGEISEILRAVFLSYLKPKMEIARIQNGQLRELLEADLNSGSIDPETYRICRKRLDSMSGMQDRVERLLPLVEKLF